MTLTHIPVHRTTSRWRALWSALRQWRHDRRLAREVQRHLTEMSEMQLRDIGLSRCDIGRVAPAPGWSALLADMNAWGRAVSGFGVPAREQRR
jgi:uncharacterized protein YjiS (DUF1127 family)